MKPIRTRQVNEVLKAQLITIAIYMGWVPIEGKEGYLELDPGNYRFWDWFEYDYDYNYLMPAVEKAVNELDDLIKKSSEGGIEASRFVVMRSDILQSVFDKEKLLKHLVAAVNALEWHTFTNSITI